MKNLLFYFVILYTWTGYAGGFRFPNIDYSYAKLYFFNLDLEQPNLMDYRIYDGGRYAASKMGSGMYLGEDIQKKISFALKDGIDELNMGLSSCFTPRHGIIYYNDFHEPVASLSICFECDKISVWGINPFKLKDDVVYFNTKKAEEQIASLAEIFSSAGVPVYLDPNEVERYWQTESLAQPQAAEQFASIDLFCRFPYSDKCGIAQLPFWHNANEERNFSSQIDTIRTTPSGTYPCKLITYKNSGSFYYYKNQLIEANWTSPAISFSSRLKTGMSWSEFTHLYLGELFLKEEISSNRFAITYLDWEINLIFDHYTIKSIQLLSLYSL